MATRLTSQTVAQGEARLEAREAPQGEDFPHAEERPHRDAAGGGSSGQGARLEARKVSMRLIDVLLLSRAA